MSEHEINRLELILSKRLTVTKAAEQVGLSRQRMSYLVNAYRRDGPVALVSGKRDKPANNKIPDEVRNLSRTLIRKH